jgi:hypothetical protein
MYVAAGDRPSAWIMTIKPTQPHAALLHRDSDDSPTSVLGNEKRPPTGGRSLLHVSSHP